MTTRQFHLGDILSVTTGILVSPRHIDGLYDILGFMTGEPLWTHQLPPRARQCAPELLRQHPDLADVQPGAFGQGPDQAMRGLARLVVEYGELREVAPLIMDDHTSIDPLAELRMLRPDAAIVAICTEEPQS